MHGKIPSRIEEKIVIGYDLNMVFETTKRHFEAYLRLGLDSAFGNFVSLNIRNSKEGWDPKVTLK